MNLYETQRSRSFTDLGRRSFRFKHFQTSFSLETARLIEAKFHVEPPCDGGMKVNTNSLCHMAKMAAMFMYGKIF